MHWVEAARRLEVTIVAGLVERDGNCLYNSAVIIDPSGCARGLPQASPMGR